MSFHLQRQDSGLKYKQTQSEAQFCCLTLCSFARQHFSLPQQHRYTYSLCDSAVLHVLRPLTFRASTAWAADSAGGRGLLCGKQQPSPNAYLQSLFLQDSAAAVCNAQRCPMPGQVLAFSKTLIFLMATKRLARQWKPFKTCTLSQTSAPGLWSLSMD